MSMITCRPENGLPSKSIFRTTVFYLHFLVSVFFVIFHMQFRRCGAKYPSNYYIPYYIV